MIANHYSGGTGRTLLLWRWGEWAREEEYWIDDQYMEINNI